MVRSVPPERRPLLLLWGFMGTGKTAVGRAIAAAADAPFADLDERLAERAGKSVAAIFRDDGEAHFRRLERQALESLLAEHGRRVIALGGGALVDPELRRCALAAGYLVVLTASPKTILARTAGSDRPLLQADRARAVERLLRERAPAYAEAHLTVASDALGVAGLCAAILANWRG